MNSSKGQRAKAASARAQLAAERERQQRRRRRLVVVVVPVAVVLVAVGALVVARLAGVGSSKTSPATGVADAGVISAVTAVPATVLNQVGVGSVTSRPTPVNAPALTDKGLPRVLYVGAEYCPYCAAERWSMVVALSRFGTFTGLGQTTSAADDVFPSTPTLSFHGSSFSSQTLAFTGVETQSNQKVSGGYAPLDTLSAADEQLVSTYDGPPYLDSAGSIPFVDIGGRYLISGASYSPQVLQGKTHGQIADALKDPGSPVAQAVDGAANVITAAICASTNHEPSAVCSSPGVQAAAKQLVTSSRVRVEVSLVVALAGVAISAYLTLEHFTSSATLACPEGAVVNCAKVTSSQWSEILGVPVAVLGLAYFLAMSALLTPASWRRRRLDPLRVAGVAGGVATALYLVWIELFRVNAICLWCTAVHLLTLVLLVTVLCAPPTGDTVRPSTRAGKVRLARAADLAAKFLLVALLVSAVIWPDLSGIKGKASTARLVVYPVGALVIPAWWFLYGRRRATRDASDRSVSYPWTADLLITVPWLLDLLGNRLNLFDTVTWWDDLMHFVNWALLTAGALWAWAPRRPVSRGLTVMCALGFGATAAVLWELGEYAAFVRKSPELQTAYTDTLGDLALGSLGALVAGLVVGQIWRRRYRAS